MIGKTNSLVGGKYKGEKVNLTLSTNQASNSDILGVNVTVEYDNKSMKYKWQGTELLIEIPPYVDYTITYSSVSGYKTPQSYSAKSVEDNSKTINATYQTELLNVTVTSDIGLPPSYTVTVSGIGSQTTASKVYKVPFGTNYTVSATAANGYSTPASQSFTANSASRSVTVEYLENVVPSVDLSMQNIFGNPTSQTTANCYVVKATGTYMFPLVFGNAIKGGSTNSAAFTKVSGEYSHDFVDYKDSVITTPYIETMSGTASGAELSMADTNGVFSDTTIVRGNGCRYIRFKVNSIPTTGANGVISVLDSNGIVMWSWHIWVWADDLTPVEITNKTGVKYKILPVNLATKKSTTAGKMYNWLYQWGRHVPMLPPNDYNSTTNATNYGVKTFTVSSGAASTYGEGIQNPQMYYTSTSAPYNWFGTTSYYNLWDANCVSTGNSDNNVVKTVYDPCPPGFKVPNGNIFTYFSTTNVVGSFSNGWKFKRNSSDTTGVFFPASGYRGRSSGLLAYVGSKGYVWLSSANSQDHANFLYFTSSYVSTQYYYNRANTMPVRPVQE